MVTLLQWKLLNAQFLWKDHTGPYYFWLIFYSKKTVWLDSDSSKVRRPFLGSKSRKNSTIHKVQRALLNSDIDFGKHWKIENAKRNSQKFIQYTKSYCMAYILHKTINLFTWLNSVLTAESNSLVSMTLMANSAKSRKQFFLKKLCGSHDTAE